MSAMVSAMVKAFSTTNPLIAKALYECDGEGLQHHQPTRMRLGGFMRVRFMRVRWWLHASAMVVRIAKALY